MNRTFTGRHMTMILVAFFGVVMVVNFIMARYAVGTFGGVVVENSYVASQHFNRWLDEAAAERALGWSADARRTADDRVEIVLAGAPAGAEVAAEARHPLGTLPDTMLTFAPTGGGRYVSREALPKDRWTLRLAVRDGEKVWRSEAPFR